MSDTASALVQQRPPSSGLISAAWWKHLFAESEDAQAVLDRAGIVIQANHKAAQQLGLAQGHSVFEQCLLGPAAADQLRDALSARSEQSRALGTIGIAASTGTCLIADVQLVPLDPENWLLVVKDASRRSRLEAHAQRLLAAIDATPDMVILSDAQFHITFVNPAFEGASGFTLEEAFGRPVDFIQVGDKRKTEEYQGSARRGADWIGELTMMRRDGAQYPVEMTFSPIQNIKSEFLGAVAFQRDISSRRRIHEAFQAERNFVQSIINSLDAAIYTLDGKLHLTHFNNSWRKMPAEHGWLSFAEQPQVGRSLLDYVKDPARHAELEHVFNTVLAEGQPHEMQSVDGNGRHWNLSVFPWHHEGQIRGLIYRVTDNTAFVGVQNQLFQAQKMSTIGAMAAGVAHDFNNLLLAIRGNVGLALMDANTSPEARTRLEQVEQAAARASDLTQQILSFSRVSEEKVTVLDFNKVIQDAAVLARRMIRGKISLKLNPTNAPLKVQMDPTRACQVLLNLCINANDVMPKGGTLTVTNALADLTDAQWAKVKRRADKQFMRCSVTDTGSGIPSELLPRIFTPFFTTKGEGKGTGLGLSIVHSVVSKAGGFIEVESVVGEGTTFHLYLPINTGPLTRTDTEVRRQMKRGGGRLLVVDDLDLVLEFAANFLKQAGYQVFTANSAESALKVLAQQKGSIDLLLTDYAMPGRNGWQLIQEVAMRWPLVKFVMASGYIDDAERTEIAKTSLVRILNKPYGIAEATGLISEVLKPEG